MRHISLITTGGTIEKTYDELSGTLHNRQSIVRRMLKRLRLENATINIVELMSKDSLDLDDLDRQRIVETVRALGGSTQIPTPTTGIVILHGTDTLEKTGQTLYESIPQPRIPIVLTGAMRPYEMTRSDALQNLTESIFATGILKPGIYCVAHSQALRFPGVTKDRTKGTFVYVES